MCVMGLVLQLSLYPPSDFTLSEVTQEVAAQVLVHRTSKALMRFLTMGMEEKLGMGKIKSRSTPFHETLGTSREVRWAGQVKGS